MLLTDTIMTEHFPQKMTHSEHVLGYYQDIIVKQYIKKSSI